MNTRNLEFFEEEKIYRHSPQLKSTDKSSEIKKKRLIIERLPTPEERAHAKIRDQFRGSTLDAILDMSKYATGTVGFDCVYGISLN